MKKLFVILFFTSLSIITFSQKESIDSTLNKWTRQYKTNSGQMTFTTKDLHKKYNNTLTLKSYDEWVTENGYVEVNDNTNIKTKHIHNILPPGDYLIKSRNRILIGFGCQITAVGTLLIGTSIYSSEMANTNKYFNTYSDDVAHAESVRKSTEITAGILSLIGLGFELSGINNIGKAGLSLNRNGIGVTVKF